MTRPRRYWLFKSEPSCFSFEDLKNRPDGTEHWDGVRNYQARNLLRDEIKPGDGVLFYHSSIPEPAVVGIARVVREGYPDGSALDPASDHFDPRASRENPVWYMVDVRYERPLARPVTLAEMKMHPELSEMLLLKRSRLSVQSVTREEWECILRLGGVETIA
ncbi:MAG: EVE domain-containing protein [Desulfuromonadales bacterium]|nr:MAG: EVE domain-containing protein [Desulfuromonadales bacterium]